MKNTLPICSNNEFRRLYSRGRNVVSDCLVMYYMPNRRTVNRLGITVTKKRGKAVSRNRMRRLIKESYRLFEDNLKSGFDIVFVARMKMAEVNYSETSRSMAYLLKKSGIRM